MHLIKLVTFVAIYPKRFVSILMIHNDMQSGITLTKPPIHG